MKKLLGVMGILALATALLPVQGHADLRGSFTPLTDVNGIVNGCEQPAYRPVDVDGIMLQPGIDGTRTDPEWFTFSTRSLIPGHESVRSIYINLNLRAAYFLPLINDPSANISYFDPAWSSDGRFMAYVQTNADGSGQALYVQEFFVNDDFEAGHGGSYPDGEGAESPVGSPILVTTAGDPRHPAWSPTGHTLAFDSSVAGSADIYTSDIDITMGSASAPTRRTFVDGKAETDPTWSPNGHDIAYSTNKFGNRVLEIINLSLSSGAPGYTRLAELNFATVSHNNPSYTSDGGSIYYDAPTGESPSGVSDVWKLDLATQAKCELQFDIRADSDPNVSPVLNHTNAGDGFIPYNYILMTSQAGGLGVQTWRANPIYSCLLPLEMGIATIPSKVDLNDSTITTFTTVMNFPPETRSAGYACRSANSGGLDGVRVRSDGNGIGLFSPLLMGLTSPPGGGLAGASSCFDSTAHGLPDSLRLRCNWDLRTVTDRIQALGLLDLVAPLKMTAYSNQAGRAFQGFAYLKFTKSSLPAPSAKLLGTSPNPFNPVTKIKFAVSKAGNYAVRLYNVQGALIRTVANGHFDAGTHEAMWDGRMNNGGKAASGVYYAKISGAANSGSDGIKLVLAK